MVAPDNSSDSEDGLQQQSRGVRGNRRASNELKRVLIVDDDPDLLDVTSFVLEGEGFGIETAKNGAEALQRLQGGTLPAVVLLDLMMPVMNGYQFLEAVAMVPSLSVIPVVVLTAASLLEVPRAAAVMNKPIDLGALVKLVERYAHGVG